MIDYESLEFVANPYGSADSLGLKGLMVQGNWQDELVPFIKSNGVESLYFNYARGWEGNDFSFLSKLRHIQELGITVGEASGLEAVAMMKSLRYQSISCAGNPKLDLSGIESLGYCYLNTPDSGHLVGGCTSLTKLYLDRWKKADLGALSQLRRLKSLTIGNSSIDSLHGMSDLAGLTELNLLNNRKLTAFEELSKACHLKQLSLGGCKGLDSLGFLTNLRSLEILDFSDCGEIVSLAALKEIPTLKAVSFAGNTKILDGRLDHLVGLPLLSMLMFKSRKHYTHKLVKQWNWNNFDTPDRLLELKQNSE
ncbi:MAG: hypothetical protein ACE361_23755 [Aureliella sp.]